METNDIKNRLEYLRGEEELSECINCEGRLVNNECPKCDAMAKAYQSSAKSYEERNTI